MVARNGGCENARDREYEERGGERPHEQCTHRSFACKFRVRIGRSGLLFREELPEGLFPVNNLVTFPTGFVAHSYSQ